MKQPVIYGSGGWVYTIAVTAPVNSEVIVSGGSEVITGVGTGFDYAFSVHKKNTTYTIAVSMDGVTKTATVTTGTNPGAMSFVVIEFGTINLTYDPGFAGHVITCTDGTTTVTKTAPSSGSTMTFYPPNTGTWTISGQASGVTYSTTATVSSLDTPVNAALQGYSEDLTVTYPSGATCTITDGNLETYTAENNPQTFTLHQAETTYTLTVTLEGQAKTETITTGSSGTAQSVTVEFGTINVTLDPLFVGGTVTCTNGTITMTKTSSTTSLTFRPPYTGTWAVSTVYDGDTYTKQATVSSLSTAVSVTLERYSENVTVTYPSGATCSITDGVSETYTATTNPQTFTLHQENTAYTLSVTLEGQTKTQTVTTGSSGTAQSVTVEFGTINVTIDADFVGEDVICTDGNVTMTKTSTTTSLTFRPPTTGTWTLSLTHSGETYGATANVTSLSTAVSVTIQAFVITIYGAQWDGTSTSTWSRTDAAANFTDPIPAVSNGNGSSPFDNLMPWSGMERVEDTNAGTLVKIPKFWYKWTRSGSTMKLQIADGPADGFLVSPAHADRGDGTGERDFVYIGAYHCGASTYKSTTGVVPEGNHTRAEFRSSIHNLGSTIWQWDYAMLWTIQMLYLVEYADWNSQAKIGYGCSDANAIQNSGLCDSMTYHTGTNAASATTYGHTRYRYIEDLWGNVFDWCDGIYFTGQQVYCIKNPSDFSDTSGGTYVGNRVRYGGYIKAYMEPSEQGFEYALYPSSIDANLDGSTYIGDYNDYNSSGTVLRVGSNQSRDQKYGLFYLHGNYSSASKLASLGSRVMKLP